jgi:Zn-dependent M28 family amino/carboxypeptidase
VDQLSVQRKEEIEAMILLDIVGDADLSLPREGSSTKSLQDFVWSVAYEIGYQHVFLNSSGVSILDDHSPFLNAGIPALDIIQLPFPSYWHTLDDTADKCNASSLEIVGQVVEISLVNIYDDNQQFEHDFPILYVVIFLFLPVVAVVIYLWHRNRS